jgi:protein-S-isoprenylcysteine O-methyltransferase Ste14
MLFRHYDSIPLMARYLVGNVVIAGFLLLFVFLNLKAFDATRDITYVLVAINEGVYVALYLVRKRAIATSMSPFDWGIAFSATFLGTLLRPANPISVVAGGTLIVVGIVINIISVLFLGRSIAIVPAERSIKTAGVYRIIRHPMYLSELLSVFGYLLVNISVANAAIAIGTTGLMLVRINREELFLSRSERYRTYLSETRWKLLPFLY